MRVSLVHCKKRGPALKERNIFDNNLSNITIEQAIYGCRVAQALVYEKMMPVAYRSAFQILRNSVDAEDVAHEAMMKAMSRLSTYNSRWSVQTWVSRIAKNAAIDLIRKRRRVSWAEVPDAPDTRPLPDEIAVRRESRREVHAALVDLPHMYRQVIDLHHFKDMKYREIASELDVPIGTVMNRLFRARQRMREALTKAVA